MPLKLALAFATLAFFPMPVEAQDRSGSGSIRETCREEAGRAFKKDRTNRMDPAQMRELRREYAANCRKKAKAV